MLNCLPNVNQINAALHVPVLHLHSFVNLMVWIKKKHIIERALNVRTHLHKHNWYKNTLTQAYMMLKHQPLQRSFKAFDIIILAEVHGICGNEDCVSMCLFKLRNVHKNKIFKVCCPCVAHSPLSTGLST